MKKLVLVLLAVFTVFGLAACSSDKEDTTKTYTVSFHVDGLVELIHSDVEYGSTVTLPSTDPTKEGYVFNGWFVNGVEFTATTEVTSDIAATAQFLGLFTVSFLVENPDYVETFELSDETNDEDEVTEEELEAEEELTDEEELEEETNAPFISVLTYENVLEGTTVTLPENDPVKEGYVFIGWYTNDVKFTETSKVTSNLELVALFSEAFTVTFVIEGADDIVFTDVIAGDVISLPTNPEVDGFLFKGWFIGEDEITSDITVVDANVEVTAKFVVVYTITFYDELSGNVLSVVTAEYGEVIMDLIDIPTKEGYVFKNWRTVEGGYALDDESTVTISTGIYATWTAIEE